MKKISFAILLLVFALQLGTSGYAILRESVILATGTAYRFRVAPLDPYDLTRGRYVSLSVDMFGENETGWLSRQGADDSEYARITVGDDGFARVNGFSSECAQSNVCLQYDSYYQLMNMFNRYYLNEKIAPKVEQYLRARGNEEYESYIIVRVKGGRGVIEGLYVNGQKVEDFVREKMEQ
jgi:uncharacterized membrane-anchored protein